MAAPDRADERLDRLDRHAAGPQQERARAGQVQHGRFHADRARPAIHHRGDAPAQPVQHVVRRGGGDAARAVGRRRRDRAADRRSRASATGCAGTRTASVSSPAPASSATGQVTRRGSTMVSGPGQNAAASARRRRCGDVAERGVGVRVVADQRVEVRPALGGEHGGDGAVGGGVRPQAVDRLGREGDQLTGQQQGRGLRVARSQTAGHRPRQMKCGFSQPGLP